MHVTIRQPHGVCGGRGRALVRAVGLAAIACALVISLLSCASSSGSARRAGVDSSSPRSIGVATMEADGTIVLQVRAVEGGAVAEALFRYPKDHPEYAAVLKHLGGMRPGESKPVPPWPDRN